MKKTRTAQPKESSRLGRVMVPLMIAGGVALGIAATRKQAEETVKPKTPVSRTGYPAIPPCDGLAGCPETMPEPRLKPFDPSAYEPPKEAGLVLHRTIDPKNKKTVIYISDQHHRSGTLEDTTGKGLRVQKQVVTLMSQLMDQCGQIPFVMEDAPYGFEMKNLARTDGPEANDPEVVKVRELLKTTDPKARAKKAGELFNAGVLSTASIYLSLAKAQDFIPVYTTTAEGLEYEAKVLTYKNEADRILSVPAASIPCSTFVKTGESSTASQETLAGAKAKIAAGERTADIVKCFCEYRGVVNRLLVLFETDRFVESPRREADAAMRAKENLAVIVSGVLHMPETLAELKRRGANVIVVSPAEIEGMTREVMTMTKPPSYMVPDVTGGSCENVGF